MKRIVQWVRVGTGRLLSAAAVFSGICRHALRPLCGLPAPHALARHTECPGRISETAWNRTARDNQETGPAGDGSSRGRFPRNHQPIAVSSPILCPKMGLVHLILGRATVERGLVCWTVVRPPCLLPRNVFLARNVLDH
jgi:hypothetical protein